MTDEAALLRLYDSCARRLHRYLARRVGAQVADDLVSDAFLIVWEKRADRELDGDDARAWLYGVATNLLRRHVRTEETRLRHLTLTEIATATSVPVATVGTRLHRARARLRRRLAVRADVHRVLRAVSGGGSEMSNTADEGDGHV